MKQYAALDDTIYLWFASNDTSGSGGDGASPAADVRLAGAAADAAPVYSPTPTLLSHVNYPAGSYEIVITASAANGFATGNTYAVFCTLAIDSQNPTGFVGSFDLKPVESDVTQWLGTAPNTPTIDGVPEVDITHLLGTAWIAPGVAGTPDVNTKLLGGTTQTGRDIGASVLLSAGTGAGQLDFTSGIVKSNLTQILAHLLTQTGTQLADGFEHFFDVATPTGTLDSLPAAAPNAAGGIPISAAGGLAMDTLADLVDGGRLDLIFDTIAADTTTDIPAKLLAYVQLLARSDAAIATDNAPELTAINADGGSGVGDFSNQTDAEEAIRDRGDAEWTTATGFSTHNAAAVWAVATRILTANTNFNDLDAAAIKSEVAAALQDIKLDHLLNIAVDTNWATTVHLDSVIGHMADIGTAATFDRTNDALEAIRNRGDSAWATATGFNTTTPPTVIQIRQEMDSNSTKMAPSQTLNDYKATGFSTHNAAAVWSVGTRALTDKAGFALSTAGIKAIWDQLTSALTTAGSIGKLLVDRIDATISSRNSTTPPTVGEIRTEMEGAGTKLTEILEDTSTTLDVMIERILGLDQENFYIDSTGFTGANMTSCRIRIYSVAGSVGTASDVIATYNMTATYAGDNLASYMVVKA